MVFVEDNDMIQTFPPNTSIESLDVRILPGTSIGRQHLSHTHRFDPSSKPISVDTVAISKKVSGRGAPRERLDNLLRGPLGRGIRRHVEVNDLTPGVIQYDEHEQQSKSNGRYDEKVHANHTVHVILDESSPGLRGRLPSVSPQHSWHGPLGDDDADLEHFAVNLGGAPERIGVGHLENQRPHIRIQRRPPTFVSPGLATPVEFESPLVPPYDYIRPHDHQGVSPSPEVLDDFEYRWVLHGLGCKFKGSNAYE
jgi:hypothetical protein